MALLPDFLKRPMVFWTMESGHRWNADRIRRKLLSGSGDLPAEAERLTEQDYGPEVPFPGGSEDDYEEWRMRGNAVEDHQRMLEITESYLWGLGVAGVYHLWERNAREVIGDFTTPKMDARKLQNLKFDQICSRLDALGYSIRQSGGFEGLDVSRMIANAIKHGEGASFTELAEKRPDLFPEHQKWLRHLKAGAQPDLDDLKIDVAEFDKSVAAISLIWPELEKAVTEASRHK